MYHVLLSSSQLSITSPFNAMKIHSRLPVELMVIISEFLLGDGAFGTLASLNTTCHVVHQETAPVLNETLVLDSEKGWWNEEYQHEANDEVGTTEKIWSQTKYVIALSLKLDLRSSCWSIALDT